MKQGERTKRTARPVKPVLALLLAVCLAACRDGGRETAVATDDSQPAAVEDAAHAPEPSRDPLRCEREGFPCVWAEVDSAVLRRTLELGEELLARLDTEAPTVAAAYAESLDGMAEAVPTEGGLFFRLDGGRRVWVIYDDGHPHRGPGRVLSATGARSPAGGDLRPARSSFARLDYSGVSAPAALQVVGKDRDDNDKINQKDLRRVLILDPYRWEFVEAGPYNQGRATKALFDDSEAYSEVVLLEDKEADIGSFLGWEKYDVIHVATHGGNACGDVLPGETLCRDFVLFSGETIDPGSMTPEEAGSFEWFANLQGIELSVSKKKADHKDAAPDGLWHLGANYDFFKSTYPDGLEKAFVFMDACNSLATFTSSLLIHGEGTTVMGWLPAIDAFVAEEVSLKLYEAMLDEGIHVYEARQRLVDAGLIGQVQIEGTSASQLGMFTNGGHRLREIVTLIKPDAAGPAAGDPLVDGDDLTELIEGQLGDGEDERLIVLADVEGIDPDQVALTRVRLHLDDEPVSEWIGLDPSNKMDKRYRVVFDGIPIFEDLQPDQEYDLEAVVELPEGGRSRYSALVIGDSCTPRDRGDFQAEVSGSFSRSIRRGDEGATSGMTPHPEGGWFLDIRNRMTSDLHFVVHVPEDPSGGSEFVLVDSDLQDATVMGGIAFGEEDEATWQLGDVEVRFTAVTEEAACGTIHAEIVGLQAGTMAPTEAPATIIARFWAEIRR